MLEVGQERMPAGTDRVRRATRKNVNEQIDRQTENNIRRYGGGDRRMIQQRIDELDSEWDIERVLEVNASTLALTGLVLGSLVNRKWLYLTGGVLTFFAPAWPARLVPTPTYLASSGDTHAW